MQDEGLKLENETNPRATMKGMAQSLDNMAEALTMIAREKGLCGVVVNFRPSPSGGFDIHLTATNDLDERVIARHILDGLEDAFTTILRERNAKLEDVAEAAAHQKVNPFLEAALQYAKFGWLVFPLVPGDKTPIKRFSGAHEATTDADLIKEWWGIVPNANVGIATGHRSRLHVIDVDDADSPVMDWLPMTLITHTPNGGHHYLYEVSDSDRFPNGSKHDASALSPDCDMRGERGHIVAPPSIVVPRGGIIAVAYRWLTGPFCSNPFMRDVTLAPLPERIRDKFNQGTSGHGGA